MKHLDFLKTINNNKFKSMKKKNGTIKNRN